MRCKACNKALSDYESTRKSAMTGDFIDLCNGCFTYVKEDLITIENQDMISVQDFLELDDEL